MWTTDPNGLQLGERESVPTDSREHATSLLVGELYESASDEFLHAALAEWFTEGRIDKLSERVDNSAFWNVVLLDDDGKEVPNKA